MRKREKRVEDIFLLFYFILIYLENTFCFEIFFFESSVRFFVSPPSNCFGSPTVISSSINMSQVNSPIGLTYNAYDVIGIVCFIAVRAKQFGGGARRICPNIQNKIFPNA